MTPDRQSYVIYGSADWNDPWLTDQNLAHALGRRGGRVLYVGPPTTPLAPFRYGIGSHTRRGLGYVARRRPRLLEGVYVFRPLTIPPREHPLAIAASGPLLRWQVRGAVRRLGLTQPIVLGIRNTHVLAGAAAERIRVVVIKDWNSAGANLLGRDAATLAEERDAMCRGADIVCAISPELQARLALHGISSRLLGHGFHSDLCPRYDAPDPPPEYANLPRPLLVFAGTIDARLDFQAFTALADRVPSGSVLLVGPVSPLLPRAELERLASRPNVHLLGKRARADLPPYLAHADCLLMPYEVSEWTRLGSPLKLWDYLYAGPPIVGAGCQALTRYPPPLVHFTSGARELAATASRLAAEGSAGRDERRAYALANSWDRRAAELEGFVDEALCAENATGRPRLASTDERSTRHHATLTADG